MCEQNYVWNPSKCNCGNGKHLASIVDDTGTICNEIINAEETSFDEKYIMCKTLSFYILLVFLLITITLLIAITIYCYIIKYRAKPKHLLPFHDTNIKL